MKTTLIVCDIQPEYSGWFTFSAQDFANFLNRVTYDKIIYFFNGYETTGADFLTVESLKAWLLDYGVKQTKIDKIEFIDKGCGFALEAIDTQPIAEVLTQIQNGKIWNVSYDSIKNQESIMFIGGSVDACLLELIVGAKAFNVPYDLNEKWIF